MAAGMRRESLFLFLGSKLALALVLPGLFIFLYALPKGVLMERSRFLYATGLAIAGFLLQRLADVPGQ